ncbi:LuxR C-terminal-related transcriptional regulator [Sphaerimonospora sp. CA-214678]|uniref:LuxR C-terminal-related transcriptional regulator n=1 Tax=Sphaerimonospora sp. CA-214678 TaxID=3240029 RepID=UPI003D8EE33B
MENVNSQRSHVGSDLTVSAALDMLAASSWEEEMARVAALSGRELVIFLLLGTGASNRAIATRLSITERTVKAHIGQILAKLGIESRLQAGLVSTAWARSAPSDYRTKVQLRSGEFVKRIQS